MRINCREELKMAYQIIYWYNKGEIFQNKGNLYIEELKREIRNYFKRKEKALELRGRIIHDTGDSFISIIKCPDWVIDEESAEEWFANCGRITYRPTYYDCTGQLFTSGYKFCKRNGNYYCYHRVAMENRLNLEWTKKEICLCCFM